MTFRFHLVSENKSPDDYVIGCEYDGGTFCANCEWHGECVYESERRSEVD